MATDAPATVERVPWDVLRAYFAREFELGQSVAIAGANGEGKTTTIVELLRTVAAQETVQGWPVATTILVAKRRDSTMQRLIRTGDFRRIKSLREWPPHNAEARVVVWPPPGDVSGRARRLSSVFGPILDEIDATGNQILFVDEAAYFERPQPNGLGLARYVETYWTTARSNRVSLFSATQRPVRVSRWTWSESWWLFIFALEDEDDIKTIASRSAGFKQEILATVPTLQPYEFLMIRRRPRNEKLIVISRAEIE